VLRTLGQGSMGAVYLVHDRERGVEVALKTLRRVDASGIYRFKREFRALADLSHGGLVKLHELFCEADEWFFTMEYVEGKHFLAYVLPGAPHFDAPTPRPTPELPLSDEGDLLVTNDAPVHGLELLFPTPLKDEARLRAVLSQVSEALLAVHATGKLHRDLKSDNVLVTAEGRAVLLDFGIAVERTAQHPKTLEAGVVGTPAYMSFLPATRAGMQ
jgi:serine/threonine protein kinase